MLGSRYECPGQLPALTVADVFAGSGSMGLEALSRGACSCCFFERNDTAVAAVRQNLSELGVGPEGVVVTRDAWTHAVHTPDGAPFDLVFLDPPYADSDDTGRDGRVRRYLRRLAENGEGACLVVLHHRASVRFDLADDEGWQVGDRRILGSNGVTLFLR
jgi:16S rRNA (guanine966-N2)-methyltransferase